MITFTVPLPPRACSSNGNKGSWRKKASATREYREAVWVAGYDARHAGQATAPQKARVSLVFCIKGGRGVAYQPRDIPNAISAFKAGFDGLVDAGLLVDDSSRHMEVGSVAIVNTRGPFVEVVLEVIE